MDHLLRNTMDLNEVQDQNIMESLLKIINFFMLDTQNGGVLRTDIATLEWINYPQLIQKLILLIANGAAHANLAHSAILGEITKNAKLLLVGSIKSKVELLETLYAIPSFDSFVLEVILKTNNHRIREEMIDGICQLCTDLNLPSNSSIPEPKKYFIPLLVGFLPTIGKYKENCEQFFDGLSVLTKHESFTTQSEDLLHQVIELLKSHPIMEVRLVWLT